MVSVGKNGLSNRHELTLNGYRVIEAIKALSETPEVSIAGEKITAGKIQKFLMDNGFDVTRERVKSELVALETAFYVKISERDKACTLTDRGEYQRTANEQGHAQLTLRKS